MPRDDHGEIEMKLLQSLKRLRILGEVREIEIAELLVENAVPVKNFLLREKHEDTIWRMRGTEINRLHPAALAVQSRQQKFCRVGRAEALDSLALLFARSAPSRPSA